MTSSSKEEEESGEGEGAVHIRLSRILDKEKGKRDDVKTEGGLEKTGADYNGHIKEDEPHRLYNVKLIGRVSPLPTIGL